MAGVGPDFWVCGDCRSVNKLRSKQCYSCRTPKELAEVDPAQIEGTGHGKLREIAIPTFHASRGEATLASALIIGMAVMQVVSTILDARLLGLVRDDPDLLTDPAFARSIDVVAAGTIAVIVIGLALLALTAWAYWLSRVVVAMPALGLGYPATSGFMAFVENFLPGLNLYRVPAIIRDVIRRLEPGSQRSETLIFAAWIGLLGGILVPRFGGFLRTFESGTLEEAIGRTLLIAAVSTGLVVVGAVFLVVLIWWIEQRIARRRAAQLAGEPAPAGAGMPPAVAGMAPAVAGMAPPEVVVPAPAGLSPSAAEVGPAAEVSAEAGVSAAAGASAAAHVASAAEPGPMAEPGAPPQSATAAAVAVQAGLRAEPDAAAEPAAAPQHVAPVTAAAAAAMSPESAGAAAAAPPGPTGAATVSESAAAPPDSTGAAAQVPATAQDPAADQPLAPSQDAPASPAGFAAARTGITPAPVAVPDDRPSLAPATPDTLPPAEAPLATENQVAPEQPPPDAPPADAAPGFPSPSGDPLGSPEPMPSVDPVQHRPITAVTGAASTPTGSLVRPAEASVPPPPIEDATPAGRSEAPNASATEPSEPPDWPLRHEPTGPQLHLRVDSATTMIGTFEGVSEAITLDELRAAAVALAEADGSAVLTTTATTFEAVSLAKRAFQVLSDARVQTTFQD